LPAKILSAQEKPYTPVKSDESENPAKHLKATQIDKKTNPALYSVFLAIVLYLIINPPRIIIQLEDGRILIKTSSSNDNNTREHRLGPKLCAGTKF